MAASRASARQRQDFIKQRILELARQRARVGHRVAQVRQAHVIDEQQVARERGGGLAILPREETETVRRMAGRFEHFDFERTDADALAIACRRPVVIMGARYEVYIFAPVRAASSGKPRKPLANSACGCVLSTAVISRPMRSASAR